MLLSILIASAMYSHFSLQNEDILEHTNAKCHLCTLSSTYKPLCNIGIHLVTLFNTRTMWLRKGALDLCVPFLLIFIYIVFVCLFVLFHP